MRSHARFSIKTVTLTCCLLALLATECRAVRPYEPVQPDPVLEPWRWRSFPELKGLGLQCLAEDGDGRMWFGVDDGVRVYDGTVWVTHTTEDGIIGAPVQALYATRDGSVYAGTPLGISRFSDGKWDHVFPEAGAYEVFGLIETADGSLWAGTSLGALHLSHEQTTIYTTDSLRIARQELDVSFVVLPEGVGPQVYDVFEEAEGRMWFGLYSGEILRYDTGVAETGTVESWRLYTAEDGLSIGDMPRIAQTPDQVIWTVSRSGNGRVNRFDGQAWTHDGPQEGSSLNSMPSILVTRDGTRWVGSHWSHLYAIQDTSVIDYHAPDVPTPPGRLIDLLEASDGALWVAGLRQEALRLDLGASRWTAYNGVRFQCDTSDGSLWFLTRDDGVVRYDGTTWTRYGVEDGLMDVPQTLIVSATGVLWAAGSQDSTAVTARFDGTRWSVETHPELSSNIYVGYGAPDGSVWFSSWVSYIPERGQLGGLLRFNGQTRTHFVPPEAPDAAYGITQTSDGSFWPGGYGLHRFDGKTWMPITEPEGITSYVEDLFTSDEDDLWVATRQDGLFRFDGQTWRQFTERDGLPSNSVWEILQTEDGSMWAATADGISRFDGLSWTTQALPSVFDTRYLLQSRDGALWFWRPGGSLRYMPDVDPPETEITLSVAQVSQPGNTALAWRGVDPWNDTPEEEIQYAWRLDGGAWSATPTRRTTSS